MSILLGATLGVGLLLVGSTWMWPRRPGESPRPPRRSVVADELALAGIPGVPLTAIVVVAIILAVVAAALAQAIFAVPVLTAVAGALGGLVVAFVIRSRANRRRAANRAIWPDVVDHLVASVRAGMSLPDSIGALAELGPAATRSAFAGFDDEFRRTGDFGSAVDSLKARLADPVADRILETLRMAREVGGTDVTSVLRGLSTYLREDAGLRAEVVARQSWIRNAARLGVAAPWLLLLVLASRPETLAAYDSSAGTVLILAGVAVTIIAYRLMLGLGRLPEERRWFT
ncbi:tight adherence protein B [Agromyces flavus]|uniref:Tight adherence protein B n=1 Tax=Agromyces flavus TaxID=589382 RepID=A0A1H1P986_9MICO|nr:type II secretion system F family protein [Agromyces flavus]MCP2367970.1 tight adherence protein B [Agromyces flavus]GGI47432.1 type II secretion system protein F [Agromyces flavus]SDS07694.1 tight adherence protein B [Agromyces flavus]